MPDLTLLILAAGIGRRYQGLKQVEPVGPSGESMLDYAVYDALRSGFSRVVFVIRRDIEDVFRRTIGGFWESRVPVSYVFQEIDGALPAGFLVPWTAASPGARRMPCCSAAERSSPPSRPSTPTISTGGRPSGRLGIGSRRFLKRAPAGGDEFGFVGYPLKKTLSEHGSVSRGVCALDGDGYLREVVERVKIEKAGDGARAQVAPGQWLTLTGDEVASMNFWGFTPGVFGHLEAAIRRIRQQVRPRPRSRVLPSLGRQRHDRLGQSPGEAHPDAGILVRDDLSRGCRQRPGLDPRARRAAGLS